MENTNEKQKCSGKGAVICGIIIGAVAAVMMIWMTVVLSGINNKLDIQNQRLTEQNQTLQQQNNTLQQQIQGDILFENIRIQEISFKDAYSGEERILTHSSTSSDDFYVTIYKNGYVVLKRKNTSGDYVNWYYLPPESVINIDL